MRFYHGTTGDAASDILQNGFSNTDNKKMTWSCSFKNRTYLWKYDAEPLDDPEDEDEECAEEYEDDNVANDIGFCRAFESAVISAAMSGTFNRDIVIFGFDIPNDLIGDGEYVEDDNSCENMYGAFQICSCDLDRMLHDGTIGFHVYRISNGYKPFMRWFYLVNLREDYMRLENEEYEDFDFFKSHVNTDDAFEALFDDPVWDYEEEEWDMTIDVKKAV